MPPRTKKVNADAKSSSKEVVSNKRLVKRFEKATTVASESTPEEVVSRKKNFEDEKGGDAKEAVPTPKAKKPCTWLKLDKLEPQLGSKSSQQSCEQGKESKAIRDPKENKRQRNEKVKGKGNCHPFTNEKKPTPDKEKEKEKGIGHGGNEDTKKADGESESDPKDNKRKRNEKGKGNERKTARCEFVHGRNEDNKKMDDESDKEIGGLIFMCNAKTKPDCFRYQLMGVPANKKDVVMNIKPGLKFFLYDYDLKLMYGVFEASSAGGMKLEPKAFGGAFPAQVRFVVHKDCLPLPESVFKKAIKDCYNDRTRKFRTELTVKQVKNLVKMFNPTPLLNPNGKSVVYESPARQRYVNDYNKPDAEREFIPLHHENQFSDHRALQSPVLPRDQLFLTEQEYRSRGLQQGRHLLPPPPLPGAGNKASNPWEPQRLDLELKNLIRNPASTSTYPISHQREDIQPDPSYLSEVEYRKYGLRGPNAAPPPVRADPYDEATTSLVNRYLSLPMTSAVPVESYPLAGRESYMSDLNHTTGMQSRPARRILDSDRAYAPYSFREQSVFNQRLYPTNTPCLPPDLIRGREGGSLSAPVSHRYSFAGPPSQLR